MALQGLEPVSAGLPQVMQDPASIPARGTMIVGSGLAGIAFLKGLGLVHSISHMVGAEFDTHHGLTNAVLLPIVLRHNEAAITAKVRPMSQAMGLETTDFESFYAAVRALLDDCDIPRSLADIGVETDEAGIQRLAAKAVRDAATGTNAAEAGAPEIADLIRRSLSQRARRNPRLPLPSVCVEKRGKEARLLNPVGAKEYRKMDATELSYSSARDVLARFRARACRRSTIWTC